jgi:hypothetical protein
MQIRTELTADQEYEHGHRTGGEHTNGEAR